MTSPVTDRDAQNRRMRREEAFAHSVKKNSRPTQSNASIESLEPRRFKIDLSLPPERRYHEVCAALKDDMRDLRFLFDEVVGDMVKFLPNVILRWICWALLRHVYDDEENAELQGISAFTGIEMYLLVCFNVVLDLLMGCSSGGAAVEPLESLNSDQTVRMMHFRTLDWGMPSLRRVLILLDYVLEPNGEPVASTVTYAGYVGVLTGVRKDLSLSLNFRATHNSDGHFVNVKYYWHHLMVLLGLRRSISSILRAHLIPRTYMKTSASSSLEASRLPTYGDIVAEASCRQQPVLTTACYLCFSSGVETTVIEKDLSTAVLASSTDFIVVTNADASTLSNNSPFESDLQETKRKSKVLNMALEELVDEANDRKACAEQNYRKLRSTLSRQASIDKTASTSLPTVEDIVEMVQRYPTTNESTHFAAVMDPQQGKIAWCRLWAEPVSETWIKKHGG